MHSKFTPDKPDMDVEWVESGFYTWKQYQGSHVINMAYDQGVGKFGPERKEFKHEAVSTGCETHQAGSRREYGCY